MSRKKKYMFLVVATSLILIFAVLPKISFSVDLEGIDLALIGGDSEGKVYGNLNLPSEDSEGRAIIWSTDNDDIIDIATGNIKKYMVNGEVSASVIATIEGFGSEKLSFDIGYINNIPQDTSLFFEDFEDEELNGGPRKNNNGDVVYPASAYKDDHWLKIENGKMWLHREKVIKDDSNNVVKTQQQYNFGSSSYTQGKSKVLIEFDVTASEGAEVSYYLRPANQIGAWQAQVRTTSESILVYYRDKDAGADKYVIKEHQDLSGGAHFKFLMDYENFCYSFWIDDKLLAKDFAFRGQNNYTGNLYNESTGDGAFDLYIDNLTISDVKQEPLSDVTLSVINETNINEVKQNLYLPAQTIYGQQISWVSENENITISGEEGIVNIDNSDKEGAVTASITEGNITYLKTFELVIPKYEKTFSSVPMPIKDGGGKEIVAYEENFDNITIDELSESRLNSDDAQRAQITNGKLEITTNAEAHHRYTISDATSTIEDRLVVEFDVIRANTAGFECWFTSGSNSMANANVLTKFGSAIQIATSENTRYHTVKEDYNKVLRSSKIAIMLLKNGTFSVWVDGERIVHNAKVRNTFSAISTITRVNFRSCTNMEYIKVDNLRVYEAVMSEVEMAESLLDKITSADMVSVTDENGGLMRLEYSGENKYECSVEFSSENNLVNPDGSINYPLVNTSENVTITATSPEGYSTDKELTVEIPANYILGEVEHDVHSLGLMLGNNEFIIPATSRGNEPLGGISVSVKVYDVKPDGDEFVCEKTYEGQYLDGGAECFVGAVKLTELPQNPKIIISIYGSETGIPLAQDSIITGIN